MNQILFPVTAIVNYMLAGSMEILVLWNIPELTKVNSPGPDILAMRVYAVWDRNRSILVLLLTGHAVSFSSYRLFKSWPELTVGLLKAFIAGSFYATKIFVGAAIRMSLI